MKCCVFAFVLLLALASVCNAQARKWTDATGKFSVKAEFVEFKDGHVRLRKSDGQVIAVPLRRLSTADQEHMQQQAAKPHGSKENTQPPDDFQPTTTSLETPENHGGFFSFAFSPDGKTVAGGTGIVTRTRLFRTSTRGGEVLVWNAETGKILRTLGTHEASVRWVQYSADGRRLASISDNNWLLKLWDTETGKAATTLDLGRPIAHSFSTLSPDGRTLVAAHGILTPVQTKKGAKIGPLNVGKVTKFELRELTAWDLGTGQARWSADATTLRAAAMSPDGKIVALYTVLGKYGEGGQTVTFYDTLTGREMQALSLDPTQCANGLVYLPVGERLAGSGGGKVWLLDPGTKSVSLGWDMKVSVSLKSLAFSSDGRSALTCDWMAEQLQLWDVSSGRELAKYSMTSATKIWYPAISSDLTRIACQQNGQAVVLNLPRDNP